MTHDRNILVFCHYPYDSKKANTTNVLHMEYSVVNGHILLTSININGVLL